MPDQDREDDSKGRAHRCEHCGRDPSRPGPGLRGGRRGPRSRQPRITFPNFHHGLQESIADPRKRLDVAGSLRAVPERHPNAFDAGIHALVELDVDLVGPEVPPNRRARYDGAATGDQQVQQLGRLRLEPDRLPVAVQFERLGIELEVAEAQPARLAAGGDPALAAPGRCLLRRAVTALHGLASRLLRGADVPCAGRPAAASAGPDPEFSITLKDTTFGAFRPMRDAWLTSV